METEYSLGKLRINDFSPQVNLEIHSMANGNSQHTSKASLKKNLSNLIEYSIFLDLCDPRIVLA